MHKLCVEEVAGWKSTQNFASTRLRWKPLVMLSVLVWYPFGFHSEDRLAFLNQHTIVPHGKSLHQHRERPTAPSKKQPFLFSRHSSQSSAKARSCRRGSTPIFYFFVVELSHSEDIDGLSVPSTTTRRIRDPFNANRNTSRESCVEEEDDDDENNKMMVR